MAPAFGAVITTPERRDPTARKPLWTLVPGSRLDADHPENGVLIPCRNTPFSLLSKRERSRTGTKGISSIAAVRPSHDALGLRQLNAASTPTIPKGGRRANAKDRPKSGPELHD
jgi:hypothetical protein